MSDHKPKSFWRKPEGITGAIVLGGLIAGGGYLLYQSLPFLIGLTSNLITLGAMLLVLGAIIYVFLDPRARNLMWYFYKSVMRWVTGLFIQIDPIGILKSYVEDLKDNLRKMNRQFAKLRAQMHKLKELIHNNRQEIKSNLDLASKAKESNKRNIVILKSRKAGRLKESNMKLEELYSKMEVLYRVLAKMYENSEILVEDIEDQVKVKEQERKAIRASHNAMRSAMSIIKGDADKRAIFDEALEAIADDVSNKVGEMERFMELSENFMSSIDLQNGVFEEEGLRMLEEWEREGLSLILGDEKQSLIQAANDEDNVLDLNQPISRPEAVKETRTNQYDNFFD
jgi:phage shock protein A